MHRRCCLQAVSLPFLISCRIFLCSLTLSNTSSFLTCSVQLIFSILLQHHITELSRRFWSGHNVGPLNILNLVIPLYFVNTTSLRAVVNTVTNSKLQCSTENLRTSQVTIELPRSAVIPLMFELVYHWNQLCVTNSRLLEVFWFSWPKAYWTLSCQPSASL